MPLTRRIALATALMLAMGAAFAQAFPNKPIKVVVPSPAGGPPDLILRAVLPKMSAILGQPIVIDNRAGAGGMVGTAYVAKQPADGYTWLFTTASHVNIPPFADNPGYDPIKDFTHVTLAAQNFGQALVVNPEVPAKNVQELIALAKKNPGKLTYANAGNGTASHIPAELMKTMAGIDVLSVPYKGIPEAVNDLLAGRIDMFFVGTNIALQHVQAGKLRALALTGSKRWKGMPDTPTMDEQGLKGFDKVNWFGLWLPAGAPPDVVQKIYAALRTAVNEPDVKQQFDQQGLEGVAMPPAEFAAFVAREQKAAQDIANRINAGAKK
ncbi:Bug family tripartite tricarboxylate transporter substrate binding protein [Ramlibacter albus]|uniref:Tripartite tricarboxylate transporter substrate binding protein n=1 Tax=Ramlibacter albus TaxID=2079448 RepID=A0A923MAI3_9BURK|nr:tripartite tricarboxylate transporter substrate binding protein [Ramlibacter albus]MBC5766405.1 tripartite tricarboxylate transporter substrate binding protein [Ramlibacter albus]